MKCMKACRYDPEAIFLYITAYILIREEVFYIKCRMMKYITGFALSARKCIEMKPIYKMYN